MHAEPLPVRPRPRAGRHHRPGRAGGSTRLSGGQRQRVLFALAVVPDPEPGGARRADRRDGRREPAARSGRRCASSPSEGRSVLFATHYLEEADQSADRIVLMAGGRVVADGPATQIKAAVDVRRIRATLPGADLDRLAGLPGVTAAERQGATVTLTCDDADAALRALVADRAGRPRLRGHAAPASRTRSSPSPPRHATEGAPAMTIDLPAAGAPPHLPQPALPVLHRRRPGDRCSWSSAARSTGDDLRGVRRRPGTWSTWACSARPARSSASARGSPIERDAGWNRQLRLTPLPPLGLRVGQGGRPACCVALPALLLVCLARRS